MAILKMKKMGLFSNSFFSSSKFLTGKVSSSSIEYHRRFNSSQGMKPKTGIMMMNLGGPQSLDQVYPFLLNLFSDRDIMQLPLQDITAQFIARRRTPKIKEQYNKIGGKSPIKFWTEKQGKGMVELLDKISPSTGPHKFYVGFRYISPMTEEAVLEMKKDELERCVAFTQYPHYSCSTTGSSLNDLYRILEKLKLKDSMKWSVIDRWPLHSGLIRSFTKKIKQGLEKHWSEEKRKDVTLLFSAHSLPMKSIHKGDPYHLEVASTVQAVMQELNFSNPYRLCWQSKVGPLKWLGPSTVEGITELAKANKTDILVIPIAFTSDHIETLFELDIEANHLANQLGANLKRVESLNDDPLFIETLADIVNYHLNQNSQMQFKRCCSQCINATCQEVRNYFKS